MSNTLQLDPITPAVGAVISGVDLREALSGDTVAQIRAAVLKHGAVFFRDQDLTQPQTVAFLKPFGRLTVDPYTLGGGADVPEELTVHDMETNNSNATATQFWHSDSSHTAAPASMLMLRALELPPEGGGDTCWSNMYLAYDSLSEAVRRMIDPMEAVHSDWRVFPLLDRAYTAMLNKGLSNAHPVVRVHPETGRKALFVNELWTERLVGVPEDESRDILEMLYAQTRRLEFMMRWRWRKNDVVFWDNCAFQHYAVRDYTGRRVLQKGYIKGERPFGPASRKLAAE